MIKKNVVLPMNQNNMENIVFYDGDCGFCNSTVQFILTKKKKTFFFIPLQSNKAKELLGAKNIQINLDTIYFMSLNKIYNKSSAALQISKGLKGGYPLLFVFYIIPKFLRDYFYSFIAKRRHKLRTGYCMIPSKENEQYFIKE